MGANCISVREEFTMSQTYHASMIIFDHPFLSFPLEGYGNYYLLSLDKTLGHNTAVNSQGYLSRQPSSTGKFYSQELMGKITQVACCFNIAYRMESELKPELKEKVSNIFQDFLIRVTKLEELAGIGSRLLNGYQQALEFLRQPPIDGTSQLIKNIIKANETRRVKSYIEAGCINVHDSIQNTNKLHTCLLGLHNHLSQAKALLNELENLLEDSSGAIHTANGCLPPLKNEDCGDQLYQQITTDQSSLDLGELEVTNYAVLMGIIYSMVKKDYVMQEKIVHSLNLKSLSGELESYCVMWSLRPFIMDEVMHHAWRLIP